MSLSTGVRQIDLKAGRILRSVRERRLRHPARKVHIV